MYCILHIFSVTENQRVRIDKIDLLLTIVIRDERRIKPIQLYENLDEAIKVHQTSISKTALPGFPGYIVPN